MKWSIPSLVLIFVIWWFSLKLLLMTMGKIEQFLIAFGW